MAMEIEIESDERIDSMVQSLDGAPRRLTIYSGRIVSFDSGRLERYKRGRSETVLWVPDSLGYATAPESINGSLSISRSASHDSARPTAGVTDVVIGAEQDPRGLPFRWITMRFELFTDTRFEMTYLVNVLADPEGIED